MVGFRCPTSIGTHNGCVRLSMRCCSRLAVGSLFDGTGRCLDWTTRWRPVVGVRKWPVPGPPADEFDATLLTFKTMS